LRNLKFTKKFLAVFMLLVYVIMLQPTSAFSSDYSSVISSRLKNAIVLCVDTPKAYVGSNIFKYKINGDSITKEAQTNFSYNDFERDPLDTPIFVLEDKGIIICKTKVFSTSTLQNTGIMTFDENIYMVSPDSTRAIGKIKAYNINTRSVEAQLTKSQCIPLFYDNQGILNGLSGNSLVRNILQ